MAVTETEADVGSAPLRRVAAGSLVVIALIFLLGVAATGYLAFLEALLGVGLCLALLLVARAIRWVRAFPLKRGIALGSALAAAVVGVGIIIAPSLSRVRPLSRHARFRALLNVKTYSVWFEPTDESLQRFTVEEQIVLTPESNREYVPAGRAPVLKIAPRQVLPTARGLLFREVALRPPEFENSGYAVETEPDGATSSSFFLAYDEAEGNVEVRELPTGCFYSASGSSKPERNPYFRTETISWKLSRPRHGVAFAYVRTPFQALRPILVPFVQLGKVPSLLVAVSFLGASGFVVLVVKPVLAEQAQALLKRLLHIKSKPVE